MHFELLTMNNEYHTPVLLKETLEFLKIKKSGRYIDATLGGGGHSEAILKAGGEVLGIDCDPEALEFTRKRLIQACPLGAFRWILIKGNFVNLAEIAKQANFEKVDGILFDLGVSSYQLETPSRGFSFNSEADLDMRMNPELKVTAADLINGLNEGELNELFTKLGEEHYSRRIARAVCIARKLKSIKTCSELADIVLKCVPPASNFDRIHPATRIFQALRIAVNDELNNLRLALPQAGELLNKEGRLVAITFHSLEDRIIKFFFKEKEKEGKFEILTPKPIVPSNLEIKINPRSRSGKLRVAEKND